MNLSIDLAGIKLFNPVTNAAGTCKTLEEAYELCKSNISALNIGSITVPRRAYPVGNSIWMGSGYSLNSVQLANQGIDYYNRCLPEIRRITRESGKKLFLSIAGQNGAEYADLAELASENEVDLLEINLGCSNVWEGNRPGQAICFNQRLTKIILDTVQDRVGGKMKAAVKPAPFSDPVSLTDFIIMAISHSMVKVVSATNTLPLAFAFDSDQEQAITTTETGLGAMGGVKPIGLGQVRLISRYLPDQVDIIGLGGITCGRDVMEYMACGAKAVGVATEFLRYDRDIQVFDRIVAEYEERLLRKMFVTTRP